jgi:hypothetical protein
MRVDIARALCLPPKRIVFNESTASWTEKLPKSNSTPSAKPPETKANLPFYLVTSNPQLVRGKLGHWRVKRVGHGTAGSEDTRINSELTKSNSKRRLSVTLQYVPKQKSGGS